MSDILKKLAEIQAELKAPKGQYNSFGRYQYRSCEDILEAVKPICKAHGCVLILSDTLEVNGNRYYIKATATLYDTETSDTFSNSALARESETKSGMDASQITGATSSYARKYALNGLFCIDDSKDADTEEFTTTQQSQQVQNVICPKCKKVVYPAKRNNGTMATPEEILKGCGGVCYTCYQRANKP